MKHKYKVIHFVNNEQVCEWKEEEIDPILYLNDFYNFIDEKQFDSAYGHGKGSKQEIYNVLKMHLKALEIIKNIGILKPYETCGRQCWLETMSDATKISKEEYDLLKEVLL